MNTFGQRLKKARRFRKLSQAQLARLCDMSQSAISSYERNERISSKKIILMAQKLAVSIIWLSYGHGEMLTTDGGLRLHEYHGPWPFPNIDPNKFWSLTNEKRELIEKTVDALITSISEQ